MPTVSWIDDLNERESLFRNHHVHGLPHRRAQIAVLWAIGLTDTEAAATLDIATGTVHNHGRRLRDQAVPRTMEPTRANAVAWAWFQTACCTASAFGAVIRDFVAAADRVRILSSHNTDCLSHRQAAVLLLQAAGLPDVVAARALAISESSLRSTAQAARERVVPVELDPTRANATAWTHIHFGQVRTFASAGSSHGNN
jgi:DNA-binding CsgD family transcriptional regulator